MSYPLCVSSTPRSQTLSIFFYHPQYFLTLFTLFLAIPYNLGDAIAHEDKDEGLALHQQNRWRVLRKYVLKVQEKEKEKENRWEKKEKYIKNKKSEAYQKS
ncbi:unnamed protein product [Prunus armeniaca]